MKKLLVATGNSHKTKEISAILAADYEVSDLKSHQEIPAVEETGTTFLENATLKAVAISKRVSGLVLSDDSGLEVDALNGEPGVYSSRYAGEDGNDAANNAKLIGALEGEHSRSGRFRCVMVIAKDGEVLMHCEGAVEGRIIDSFQGEGGFGYDPLFIPEGHEQTFAQLGETLKNTMSHRARAMETVKSWLVNYQEPA